MVYSGHLNPEAETPFLITHYFIMWRHSDASQFIFFSRSSQGMQHPFYFFDFLIKYTDRPKLAFMLLNRFSNPLRVNLKWDCFVCWETKLVPNPNSWSTYRKIALRKRFSYAFTIILIFYAGKIYALSLWIHSRSN